MTKAFFAVAVVFFAVGCGGSDDGGDGGTGGSAGSGGSTGGGGSSSNGGMSSDAKPMGSVVTCFGTCPMGECDNDMFFADVACSSVYTAPVTASSSYCTAEAAGYCLDIGKGGFDTDSYAIVCAAGVATIDFCEKGGCSASGSTAQCL